MSAAAIPQLVFMVRHEHVQHLGRTDSVEHLHAKLALPLRAEMRRQCFTRRDAESQARTVELPARAMVFEQQVVDHRHTKKDRRTMLGKDPPDDVWRWLFTTENRRRSVQERKRKTISQSISEGQSRR